jgi:hypothetical protein
MLSCLGLVLFPSSLHASLPCFTQLQEHGNCQGLRQLVSPFYITPRQEAVLTVETRSPSQAEWAATLPTQAAGAPGDLGASSSRKIFMNFYHVYAVLMLSEVDVRTGNRGTSCLGLIVLLPLCPV